jgi:hypothetical protein
MRAGQGAYRAGQRVMGSRAAFLTSRYARSAAGVLFSIFLSPCRRHQQTTACRPHSSIRRHLQRSRLNVSPRQQRLVLRYSVRLFHGHRTVTSALAVQVGAMPKRKAARPTVYHGDATAVYPAT